MKKLLTLMAAVALSVGGLSWAQESAADPPGKPNILFIQTDDNNVYTYETAMKNTQKLIEDQGIRFENATYSMSACCPSRASILRGQYTHNTGVWKNTPPNGGFETFKARGLNRDTYATRIHSVGYNTAYFGKYMNGYPERGGLEGDRYYKPSGWDTWYGSTKNMSDPRFVNSRRNLVNPEGSHDKVIGDYAVTWLKKVAKSSEPFLGVVDFHAPHAPAWSPEGYGRLYRSEPLPNPPSFNEADMSDKPPQVRKLNLIGPKEKRELIGQHRKRLRSAHYADVRIAQMLAILAREGELKNTYVVFYSDNGYHMGEHRLPSHEKGGKTSPYIEDTRFPIIVRGPGIAPGATSKAMVQNIDLRPTFEDVANAQTPSYVDGVSFLRTATTDTPFPRRYALSERLGGAHGWRAVYDADEAYHLWGSGAQEYYDLTADRYQLESNPDDPRAALMHRVLVRMKDCDGAECRTSGP